VIAALPDFTSMAIEHDDHVLVIGELRGSRILRGWPVHFLPKPSGVECTDSGVSARTLWTGTGTRILLMAARQGTSS